MAEIHNVDGRPTIDYTARDYDRILAMMRSLIPDALREWTDHDSEADFGNVLLELFAHMGDVLSYYQDRIANESFLSTARTRRSVIDHLRLIGYELATAAPAAATLQVSVPASASGEIAIHRGDAFATRSERDRPSVRFEYNGDDALEIDLGAVAADAGQTKRFELPVEESRLVPDQVLGTSDGTAHQRFKLLHSPLILRSRATAGAVHPDIELITQVPGGEPQPWVLKETLAFSLDQRDYVIEIDDEDQATTVFGDGALGAIPERRAEVRATYRVGGGAAGNVPAGTITTIVRAPALAVLGAKVTNPLAAVGGSDREALERAVSHAPAVFRSLRRAVTTADYEALALDYPGVGKVRARPANPNTVTLHVAPAGGGEFVSDELHRGLLEHFEDKRPISTRVDVAAVRFVDIRVVADIGIVPYHSAVEVERQVRAATQAVLAFDHVDFGQQVYLSRFYEVIEAVDGVRFANIAEFRRADRPADPGALVEGSGVITLGADELPRGAIDVTVVQG